MECKYIGIEIQYRGKVAADRKKRRAAAGFNVQASREKGLRPRYLGHERIKQEQREAKEGEGETP